jgi:2'-5' RNA ligase
MPDVVRHYPAKSNIKQQRASNMFHYTLARLETRQRKINDLHRAVANPFAAHCSSWA